MKLLCAYQGTTLRRDQCEYHRLGSNYKLTLLTLSRSAAYIPKLWPAILSTICYAVSGLVHWRHYVIMRQKYMLTLTVGMTLMSVGLMVRMIYSFSSTSLGLYIFTTLLVLLSPCAFLATDYVLLARISHTLGPEIANKCLLVPSSRIVKIFIWSDVVTFLLQMSGGGMGAIAGNIAKLGQKAYLRDWPGASTHLVCILHGRHTRVRMESVYLSIFLLQQDRISNIFLRRLTVFPSLWFPRKRSSFHLMQPWETHAIEDWRILFFAMCCTCVGILIRSVFRIAELSQGYVPLFKRSGSGGMKS
ncbi:lipid-translocating exporter [Heterobasidion irregulare TC 32-1]|uniref:Lipid-translocating exporter n=1 Tax=Heterobasidion irregulare (strain TC 32-1) TaxID=747525 RepID=W4JY58_HETIT|nr:lipid-translocating exporter [Heterobasidion irregulare TC 32-1]ETW77781.1 lipid-translocating exporter [Heterobasidion irregulare TC 32-1]